MYFEAFGQPIVVISTTKVVRDLFEKRAFKYSSRVQSPMLMDVMDLGFGLTLKPYGKEWRVTRREFHSNFNASKITKFYEHQARLTDPGIVHGRSELQFRSPIY